jgi:hypothetical protein
LEETVASSLERIASLEAGPPLPPSNDSSGNGSSSYEFPPKGQRRTVVFGMWNKDTPREDIVKDLKTFVPEADHQLVDKNGWITPAKFSNKGKIRFETVPNMWSWIDQHKGQMFKDGYIWWSVDKPLDERNAAKKVGIAIGTLKDYVISREGAQNENDLKARVPADYDNNFVMLRSSVDSRAVRILEKPRGEALWARAVDAPELAGFDWAASLAKINAGA